MTKASLKTILADFFKNKPVLKAYVFGSFAKNTENESSDIDILVELDYSERIGLRFVEMQMELEKIFKRKVDLLSTKSLSKHIAPFVDQDKILVYAK